MRGKKLFRTEVMIVLLTLLFVSQCMVAQWVQTNGPAGGSISSMQSNATYVFASTGVAGFGYGSGVFRSADNGLTWKVLNTPTLQNKREYKNISSLAVNGSNIAAASPGKNGAVFISTDNGDTWTTTSRTDVVALTTDGTKYFAATDGSGIYSLDFASSNWTPIKTGLTSSKITSILVNGSTLYATAWTKPLFRSTNGGGSWTNIPLPAEAFNAFSVAMINNKLYIGTQNGVYISLDSGTTWTGPLSGISASVYSFLLSGSKVFTGGYTGLYSVPETGGVWTTISNKYSVTSFLPSSSDLFMATTNLINGFGGGVFISTDNGTNWKTRSAGIAATTVSGLAKNGTTLLANTNTHGLFSSTDKGVTWTLLTPDAKAYDGTLQTLLVTNGKIFASSATGYISSSNDGLTWSSTPGFIPSAFFAYGSRIFAGEQGGIRVSTDGGTSWNQTNTGLTGYLSTNCFNEKNGKLFAGLYSAGVFVSTDSGATWVPKNNGLTNLRIRSFVFLGEKIYAGTDDGGVFVSTNEGNSWTATNTGLNSLSVMSLVVSGSTLFAGTNEGVEMSNDSGKTWVRTSPWPVITNSLLISGTEIYAGTLSNGVWRRPLSELITKVEGKQQTTPEQFSLDQNYPNPFNPSTTIQFNLIVTGFTSLKVFDVLGREIATLVNEEMNAGSHHVLFDPKEFSSAIYFYQLRSGNFVDTKRMMLIK